MRHIADLPVEVLRNIFGHIDIRQMPAVACVCRLWRGCVASEWGAGATIDGVNPAEHAAVCGHAGPLGRLCGARDWRLWTDRVAALSLLSGRADVVKRLCAQYGPPTRSDSFNRITAAIGLLLGSGIVQVARLRAVGCPWGDGMGACAAATLSPDEIVDLLRDVDSHREVHCAFIVASALDRVDVLGALHESRWRFEAETWREDCFRIAGPTARLWMDKRSGGLCPSNGSAIKDDSARRLIAWIAHHRAFFVAEPRTCLASALFRTKIVPSTATTLDHPMSFAKAVITSRASGNSPFPTPNEIERRSNLRIAQRRLHGRRQCIATFSFRLCPISKAHKAHALAFGSVDQERI
jgi:hypothetical protein